MFLILQKKFKQRITAIILLIITIPFVALYLSFKFSLERDYAEKKERLYHQITQTLNLRLLQIENSVKLYAFKYQLDKVLVDSSTYSFSNNDLKNFPNYCPDISNAFIFDTALKLKYYNSGSLEADFRHLISEYNTRQYLSSDKPIWFSAYLEESSSVFWICNMPICSEENTIVGYVSILIENNKFNSFFDNLNVDYCRDDLFYLYSEHGGQISLKEIQTEARLASNDKLIEAIASDGHIEHRKTSISVYPLSSDTMKLVSISKNQYIHTILRNFFLLLFGIWIVLLVICCFISEKITDQFIFDLQNLCNKVTAYTKSKKFTK